VNTGARGYVLHVTVVVASLLSLISPLLIFLADCCPPLINSGADSGCRSCCFGLNVSPVDAAKAENMAVPNAEDGNAVMRRERTAVRMTTR